MEKLTELKMRIADVTIDPFTIDWYLMVWLRFHKMDVGKTVANIRISIKRRQEYVVRPDQSTDAILKALSKEMPYHEFTGKDGLTPVLLECLNLLRPKALAKKYGKKQVGLYVARYCYQLERDYINAVNRTYQDFETKANLNLGILTIHDLHGLSLWENLNPTGVDLMLSTLKLGIEILPMSSNIVGINATKISSILISATKLFVHNLLTFQEGNLAWKDAVSNYVDPEVVIANIKLLREG